MENYSTFLKMLVIAGLIVTGSVSVAYAQSVVQDAAAVQPPSQTLFQETVTPPSFATDKKESGGQGAVAASPGAQVQPTLNEAPAGVSASPNVSTGVSSASGKEGGARGPAYLSKEKVSEKSSNQGDGEKEVSGDSATLAEDPQIPGVDPNAPGLNLTNDLSDDAKKERAAEQKRKDDLELRQEAFKSAADQAMPLKPSEIRRIMEMYDETTQAVETPVYPSPEPESAFQTISLDPGTKPLVVKTAMGNVTTLSIVDVTGQPWPIQDLTWAGDFQIEQPEKGSHMLRITPTSEFASGNISMRLLGLNPPVIFSLKAERKSVHVRLDVQIPEVGPNGMVPPVETPITTKAGDNVMTSVLMGVVKGADIVRLQVDGIDGRTTAYKTGGLMYIRTPYTMLSPAWLKSVQSADGMKVYSLNYTPVVLLSDKGKMVRAYLSYKETSNEQY